jgi:hypothetical protein
MARVHQIKAAIGKHDPLVRPALRAEFFQQFFQM